MKTAIKELIEKLTEARNFIIANDEYAKGYDGALSDCLRVSENLIEKEKKQIIDAVNSQRQIGWDEKGIDYYNETFN